MATPQELYDETKTRLDLNIAKAQMLEREIQEKVAEKNQLMQPIMEDHILMEDLQVIIIKKEKFQNNGLLIGDKHIEMNGLKVMLLK